MEAKCLLVLLVRRQMQGYALKLTRRYRGVVEREEILGAVDLALLKAAHRYEHGRGSFIPYAFIWVRREVLKHLRSELAWLNRRRDALEDMELEADGSVHEDVERAQLSRLLEESVHQLWCAHVGEGRSLRELASATKLSLREVQRRIARSQRRLSRLHGCVRPVQQARRARCH